MKGLKNISFNSKKLVVVSFFIVCAILCSILGLSVFEAKAEDIIAPTTGFNKVVHYEFRDTRNLGKDSLNNYNLVAEESVIVDEINGGVKLDGLLYAPKITGTDNDFSDLIKGSFSISMRTYMSTGEKTTHRFFATGSYASSFTAVWRFSGFQINFDSETLKHFGTNQNSALTTGNIFTTTPAWYRINMIYDQTAKTFKMTATKEGDSTFAFEQTETLATDINFGGYNYSFTIGAGSNFGKNVQNRVAMDSFTPSISDFRIYSGVIDSQEISNIATYDNEGWELDEIPTVQTECEGFVHYEFNDKNNLGKDTLGNYDLVVGSGVTYDEVNGGVTVGKPQGILYAPKITGTNNDFSDLITGSYSISMRVYIREVDGGGNYLVATGSYSSHFRLEWSYSGLKVGLGNGQESAFGSSSSAIGNTVLFDSEFSWYRINMIYDDSSLTFRVMVKEENNDAYSYDYTAKLASPSQFGGHTNTFTIGAQSNFGSSIAQYANGTLSSNDVVFYPNVSDFRLYKGMLDEEELLEIEEYDAEKYFTVVYKDGDNTLKETKVLKTRKAQSYVPEKAGYVFDGWYLDKNLTQSVTKIIYEENEMVTVYAKWSEKSADNDNENNDTPIIDPPDTAPPENNTDNKGKGCKGNVQTATLYVIPICLIVILLTYKIKTKKE